MAATSLKDKDLQRYYEELGETMRSPGWKFLLEDIALMKDNYSSIFSVTPEQSLDFRRGQLDIAMWLEGRQRFNELAYEMLLEEEEL
jgi:hypothetical protein